MFPVVHPKTAMCNTVFYFLFYQYKNSMHNLFINRTRRYTCINDECKKGSNGFDISKSEIDLRGDNWMHFAIHHSVLLH